MPHVWFWWLVEDSKDKHDKLAVQLGLSVRCFLGAQPIAPFCDTLLSRPKPDCVKAHLCDSDLEPCRRWVRPRKRRKKKEKKVEREQGKKCEEEIPPGTH